MLQENGVERDTHRKSIVRPNLIAKMEQVCIWLDQIWLNLKSECLSLQGLLNPFKNKISK